MAVAEGEGSAGWLGRLVGWLLRRLSPEQVGRLFEDLQIHFADPHDARVGRYAIEFNNPQALCFVVEAYPTLQGLFAKYPRMSTIRMLDIGPAFGAAAGLIAQMHCSHFLGPRVLVDALDIVESRRSFIQLSFPRVRFLHASVSELEKDQSWDIVYCSNTIEHLDDPQDFVREVMSRTRGYAVFLAPYREAEPLSPDHRLQITEESFRDFEVVTWRIFQSAAWPTTAEGLERWQILVVLKACPRRLEALAQN